MSYTLSDRRAWVRQFGRNALDSSAYPDAQVDRALKLAGNEWVRLTKTTRQLSTLALSAGSPTVPALPTGCVPERILQAFLTLAGKLIDPAFKVTSYEQVLSAQADVGPTQGYFPVNFNPTVPNSGQPKLMGYIDQANAIVYPTPDAAYVIQLWWWAPVTAFTVGAQGDWSASRAYQYGEVVALTGTLYTCVQANTNNTPPNTSYWTSLGAGAVETPGSVTFNLPDEHLELVDTFGAPAFLQFTEPTKAYASDSFKQMLTMAEQIRARNAGGRGGKVSIKAQPE